MHTTDHADPDDPTSMALPVIGDRVRLTDGDEGTVVARSQARPLSWRVQDGDPEHGVGWSRWVELHEIAGYPEAPAATVCPRCAGTNGRHGMVHQRYGNGWGPCPNTPVAPDVEAVPDQTPTEPIGYVIAALGDWVPAVSSIQDSVHATVEEARAEARRLDWANGVTGVRILALLPVEDVAL
jgi:hypothetical protein